MLIAVLAAGAFVVAFLAKSGSARHQIGSVTSQYFRAVGEGDGETAFALLCPEVQATVSRSELAGLARAHGGIEVESAQLRGTHGGFWPWSSDQRGVSWARLRVGGGEMVVTIEVRLEGRWLICPRATTGLLGRPRH